jgi:hypothetical protein
MTKIIPPRRKFQPFVLLFLLSFILIGVSCQKKDFNQEVYEPVPDVKNKKDLISMIDSLQQIGFFIKDRPSPDAPIKRVNIPNTNVQLLNTGNEMEYTDETYMQFGPQLVNPYSIPIMTQAYNAYFAISITTVPVTHHYLRINATSEAQIAMLDDSLELDLYTDPLDREMIMDGDLYVAPGGNIEDMPVLYTVVPANYILPAGIPSTLLAELHLPAEGTTQLMLEEIAESIAAGASYSSTATTPTTAYIVREDVTLPNGSHPNYTHQQRPCAPTEIIGIIDDPCPDPGGGGITPPPPPPMVCGMPGLNCMEPGKPSGRIRVRDTQLNQCIPVHDVQVRAKRWFKIKNTHTDIQGMFYISTSYNNNAKIQIIFRNGEISVKPLRNKVGIRLSLFPAKARIGTFSGCQLNTVDHIFYRTSGGSASEPSFGTGNGRNRFTRTFLHWLAANAINSRKYQIAQGNNDNVKPLPGRASGGHRFQLYLATGGTPSARGAYLETPMLAYINKGFTWNDVYDIGKVVLYAAKAYASAQTGNVFATTAYTSTAVQSLLTLVFQGSLPDAIYYYNTPNLNLSSSEVSQKFYEAFTIAGLLKERANKTDWKAYLKKNSKMLSGILAGYSWYVTAKKYLPIELNFIQAGYFNDEWFANLGMTLASIGSASLSLYQSVSTLLDASDKELFDMYNGYSEAYAHFLTNRRYGVLSDDILDQNFNEIKSTASISSNIIYIETWKSSGVADKMSTIPMSGIFYDLWDQQNDNINPPSNKLETVQNISWENIAKAGLGKSGFIPSPDEFWEWRTNLTQTNASQSTQINNLFNWYLLP